MLLYVLDNIFFQGEEKIAENLNTCRQKNTAVENVEESLVESDEKINSKTQQKSSENVEELKRIWLSEKQMLLSIIKDMKKGRKELCTRCADQNKPMDVSTKSDSSDCDNLPTSGEEEVEKTSTDKDVKEHRKSSEFKMYVGKSSRKLHSENEPSNSEADPKSKQNCKQSVTRNDVFNERPEKDTGGSQCSDLTERGNRVNSSLVESYTIVSQLDNFLNNERKKIQQINSRFESENEESSTGENILLWTKSIFAS